MPGTRACGDDVDERVWDGDEARVAVDDALVVQLRSMQAKNESKLRASQCMLRHHDSSSVTELASAHRGSPAQVVAQGGDARVHLLHRLAEGLHLVVPHLLQQVRCAAHVHCHVGRMSQAGTMDQQPSCTV